MDQKPTKNTADDVAIRSRFIYVVSEKNSKTGRDNVTSLGSSAGGGFTRRRLDWTDADELFQCPRRINTSLIVAIALNRFRFRINMFVRIPHNATVIIFKRGHVPFKISPVSRETVMCVCVLRNGRKNATFTVISFRE